MKKKTASNEDPVLTLLSDYYLFFKWCWPIISQEPFVDSKHIKIIARRLQYLGMKIINREKPDYLTNLFSVPPGSTKSSLISQAWINWLWLLDPSIKLLDCSYAASASEKNSFVAKQIFKSEEYQGLFNPIIKKFHGKDIFLVKDWADDWENNFGGKYFATSTTGTATSFHFHVLVFDDPMNARIADSDTERERSNRMHDSTFPSRKINKEIVPSIYVAQRLHEDDTLGHVMKKADPFYYLCLPAELSDKVSPPELRELYDNGLLDPIRMNHGILDKYKTDLGSYGYACQFGQSPYPEAGGHIKKDWFMFCEEAPGDIAWDLWIDGAYTEKAKNDPSGFMICGFHIMTNRLYIKHCSSDRLTIPDVIKKVVSLVSEYGDRATMIHIEPKASGYSFIQMIQQETLFNVTRITGRLVQDGKMARVKYAAPKVESSRVYLVKANWNNEFITQLTAFPNYSHDEYCDLLGYAVKHYFG